MSSLPPLGGVAAPAVVMLVTPEPWSNVLLLPPPMARSVGVSELESSACGAPSPPLPPSMPCTPGVTTLGASEPGPAASPPPPAAGPPSADVLGASTVRATTPSLPLPAAALGASETRLPPAGLSSPAATATGVDAVGTSASEGLVPAPPPPVAAPPGVAMLGTCESGALVPALSPPAGAAVGMAARGAPRESWSRGPTSLTDGTSPSGCPRAIAPMP